LENGAFFMTIRTGIVVPTLGNRPEYLRESLESIRASGECYVLVVAPEGAALLGDLPNHLFDVTLADPGAGLAAAINSGVAALPPHCVFATWLGDDDKLIPNSLASSEAELESSRNLSAVFGICEYIDETGSVFWRNKLGRLSIPLLSFGPNRIPQPGSIFRREAFDAIGGLDTTLGWAFDQDMFTRLKRVGKLKFSNQLVAQFRWHANSLSAGSSADSIRESSRVRLKHANVLLRAFLTIAEPVHVYLAVRLGGSLTKRIEKS
jgi:GT2 family glycosyltransferase